MSQTQPKKRGPRGPYKKFSEADQISIAHEAGNNCEVGRRHGLDSSTIRHWRLKYGVPPEMIVKSRSIKTDANGTEEGRWEKSELPGLGDEAQYLPDPKRIKSISTMTTPLGKRVQWVREEADTAQRENLWKLFAEEIIKTIVPAEPIQKTEAALHPDLMPVYVVGDHHHGVAVWGEETGGTDYDLAASETLLARASQHLIDSSPPSEQSMLVFLGDFTHADSHSPTTPQSKHVLDVSARYQQVVRTGIRMIRYTIDAALRRHGSVHVIFEQGNHDTSTAAYTVELLNVLYESEPRVTVDTSPSKFHYHLFGKNLVGVSHGDGLKLPSLPGIMACDRPVEWGQTEHRVWLTGHIHHQKKQEYAGCTVEAFGVLPPSDAWAFGHGYRSKRSMQCLILHRLFGEVGRLTCNPAMFEQPDQIAA